MADLAADSAVDMAVDMAVGPAAAAALPAAGEKGRGRKIPLVFHTIVTILANSKVTKLRF